MSKTLSKVLVICAMVVVLPLMIVGTAFAAYYSIDNIVNVSSVFVNDEKAAADDVYARISFNGKKAESLKINESHLNSVDVVADFSSEAYVFEGWFAGNKEQYQLAASKGEINWASTERTLSINMTNGGEYVAVYNVARYYVSGWEYKADPEDSENVTTIPEGGKSEAEYYVYGEALPELTCENSNFDFGGWQIVGDETKVENKTPRYKTATFKTSGVETDGKVSLTSPWQKKEKITATLQFNEKEISSQVSKTVTFNDSEYAELENWFNLEAKYSFWEVEGVEYNGFTYTTAQTLANAAYNDDSVGQYKLKVNKSFTSVKCNSDISFESSSSPTSELYKLAVYTSEGYDLNLAKKVTISDGYTCEKDGEGENTLEDLFAMKDQQLFTKVANSAGGFDKWIVNMDLVKVQINGHTLSINISEQATINEFIEKVLAEYKNDLDVELEKTSEVLFENITVCFRAVEQVIE